MNRRGYLAIANLLAKRVVTCFIPILIFCGCSKDDSVQPNLSNVSSVVYGSLIYTISQGDNQVGAPGSTLPIEIKIIVRNIEGGVVRKNFNFQLSDESGSFSTNYYSASDTLNIRWKLGCSDGIQTMKIIDPHVCGVSKKECLEVEIFEISANSSAENLTGWISPCLPFNYFNSYSLQISNDKMGFIQNDIAYTTNDPKGFDWEASSINEEAYYSDVRMSSQGDLYYFNGYEIGILDETGKDWKISSSPAGYLSYDDRIEKAGNGKYYLATEYDEKIYVSANGQSWSEFLDIQAETGGASYDPQAIISEGDYLYIISNNNYVIAVNVLTSTVSTYNFGSYWSSYDDLGDFKVQAINSKIFLLGNYDDHLFVIDLNNLIVQSFNLDSYSQLVKSNDKLFVIEDNISIKEWTGSSLSNRSFSYPDHLEYYSIAGIYNGYPVLSDYNDNIYIYFN